MVLKKKLIYWGTIALIVFFVIEFFWPLMYSPQREIASPTPQVERFEGSAIANGVVVSFSNQGLAYCNATIPLTQDFFSRIPGVLDSKQLSNFITLLTFNESQADLAINSLNEQLALKCVEHRVLRSATLRLTDASLNFKSSSLSGVSKSVEASVFSRGLNGAIDASARVNESLKLLLVGSLVFVGDKLQEVSTLRVEQVYFPTPTPLTTPQVTVEVITANSTQNTTRNASTEQNASQNA